MLICVCSTEDGPLEDLECIWVIRHSIAWVNVSVLGYQGEMAPVWSWGARPWSLHNEDSLYSRYCLL